MPRKLYRSYREKMLGGVAGGLGEYFDIDPSLVRLAFVLTVLAGGAGFIAYIIMWIVIPQEPYGQYNMPAGEPAPGAQMPPQNPEMNQPNSEAGTPDPQASVKDPVADYFNSVNKKKEKRGLTFGIILIVVGIIILADNVFDRVHFHDLFPLILVGIGIVILLNAYKK